MGITLTKIQTGPKVEDRNELVLHAEDVKEKQVNTKDSKDISRVAVDSSNNDISKRKMKGVKITYNNPIIDQYLLF